MDVGLFCCRNDLLLGSIRFSVGDIFANGTGKQINILLHNADLASETFQRERTDVMAIYGNLATGHIIETGKQ